MKNVSSEFSCSDMFRPGTLWAMPTNVDPQLLNMQIPLRCFDFFPKITFLVHIERLRVAESHSVCCSLVCVTLYHSSRARCKLSLFLCPSLKRSLLASRCISALRVVVCKCLHIQYCSLVLFMGVWRTAVVKTVRRNQFLKSSISELLFF